MPLGSDNAGRGARVLIIAHELTLTGSPMNLLHFLTWIRTHTEADVEVLALAGGPLRDRFEALAPTTVLDIHPVAAALAALQGGLEYLGSSRAWRPVAAARMWGQLRNIGPADLVYCNSLPAVSIVPYLHHQGAVIAHAHELAVAFRLMRPHAQELYRCIPDRWIAASEAVAQVLVDEVGIAAASVSTHHEFIDGHSIARRRIGLRELQACRNEYRIPADAALVVGAGSIEWRKGPDLFVQLACEVRRRRAEPVHFVWVGGDLRSADWHRLRSDRDRAGADHVHFVGVRPDPVPWFAAADVFALTSREDPYPLVLLENAALGNPIVSYRNGGAPELLLPAGPEAAGGIIDHLDVGAMADATIAFLDDDIHSVRAGKSLQRQVLENHDVSVAAPELWKELLTMMDGRRA